MSRRSEEQDQARSRGRPETLPKRWSAQRKAEVVRVAPPELEPWRRVFLDGGQQSLLPAGTEGFFDRHGEDR